MQLPVHLISDSTGETVRALARAALAQFKNVDVVERTYPFVTQPDHVEPLLERVSEAPGVVFFTLVRPDVRQALMNGLQQHRLPFVDVLGPALHTLGGHINQPVSGQPGGQHVLDRAYFARIDAIHFTLAHDDGQGQDTLAQADIVLVGVSRTSKTPTSMYMANRGYRVANVPLLPNMPLPPALETLTGPVVLGLTIQPDRLMDIRRHRLRELGVGVENEYVDPEAIRDEVRTIERLIRTKGWPVLDVTRRSIEETAVALIDMAHKRGLKHRLGPEEA
jgi:regulator of PEP synthase PpsR (kinase-PPPase family)